MRISTVKDKETGLFNAVVNGKVIRTCAVSREQAKAIFDAASQIAPLVHTLQLGKQEKISVLLEKWREFLPVSVAPRTVVCHYQYAKMWMTSGKLEDKTPVQLDERHIAGFINGDPNVGAGTRAVRLAAVRHFFKWMLSQRLITHDPAQVVTVRLDGLAHDKKEVHQKQAMKDSEIAKVLKHIDEAIEPCMKTLERVPHHSPHGIAATLTIQRLAFWRVAILLGRHAGLRLGDICQLEWAAVSGRRLNVWTDKRDKRVSITIPQDVALALSAMPRSQSPYCFPEQRETIIDPVSRAKLSTQFARLLKAVGITGKSFHSLRSSYATACERDGVPMPHISARLGHGSTVVTQKHYIK